MTQTRLGSLYEALFNIVIGFSINFVANIILIPMFTKGSDGMPAHISLSANWWMGCLYTVISLVRSYVIRRWFNARLQSLAQRLAA